MAEKTGPILGGDEDRLRMLRQQRLKHQGPGGRGLIGTSLVSSVYDLVAAPKAAPRANARHGLTTLSVLPVPIAGPSSVVPGIAVGGQF